eukprot:CAMPEP_0117433672 /NCGR_PEP_ID=MMETSP0758-20121206/12992_1 /TAXON_ID=63605 /ORGANISM="Percolomonas cosmopolitus, Strain AE-1 (ATCC 50343)" /LENGTH=122 /DNA_ID=CAMNT_0005224487 /DNA_START=1064 /DNA_END=1432 /DNA_ORIENTATION=+
MYQDIFDPSCCVYLNLMEQCVKNEVAHGFIKEALPSEVLHALGTITDCPIDFPIGALIAGIISSVGMVLGVCCCCIIILIVVIVACCCLKKKKKKNSNADGYETVDEKASLTKQTEPDQSTV